MTLVLSRRPSWARLVSNFFVPPIIFPALGVAVAQRDLHDTWRVVLFSEIYGVVGFVFPAIYVLIIVRRGTATDVHLPQRSERYKPFTVAMICLVIMWFILAILGAPHGMMQLATFTLFQSALLLFITLFWQISVHGANIAGAIVIIGVLFGAQFALLLSPLIVLVGASRLALKRHTPMQIIAGAAMSAVIALVVFKTG